MNQSISLKATIAALRVVSHLAPQAVGRFCAQKFMSPRRRPRPEEEREFLKHADESGRYEGCGYWIWGEGPTILLLHGWEGRGTQLRHFVDPLVMNGYRVVMWEAPAHGDSDGSQVNLILWANALELFLSTQPPLYGAVAHSFAGVALKLASDRGVSIRKLVTIASPASVHTVFDQFLKTTKISQAAAVTCQREIEKIASHRFEDIDKWTGKTAQATLSIHCRNDREVDVANIFEWKQSSAHSETVIFHGLGHRRILRDTSVINRVLEFVGRKELERRQQESIVGVTV